VCGDFISLCISDDRSDADTIPNAEGPRLLPRSGSGIVHSNPIGGPPHIPGRNRLPNRRHAAIQETKGSRRTHHGRQTTEEKQVQEEGFNYTALKGPVQAVWKEKLIHKLFIRHGMLTMIM